MNNFIKLTLKKKILRVFLLHIIYAYVISFSQNDKVVQDNDG